MNRHPLNSLLRRRRRSRLASSALHVESLECRRLLAGDVGGIDRGADDVGPVDPDPAPPFSGSVSGIKWEDLNRNARRDADEPGLAGVTIYVDENRNGELDRGEIHTVTLTDDPDTEIDETGHYEIVGLDAGRHVIREIVPDGFVQTFPLRLTANAPLGGNGAHIVTIQGGENISDIDFGNHRREVLEPGSVHGRKWRDVNGNGVQDADEPGLGGVIIYSDLNRNGRLDRGEPLTRTSHDIPETDFDEAGLYELSGLRPGEHFIREVVPDGFVQTFPPLIDVLPVDDQLDEEGDELVSIRPQRLDLFLSEGEETVETVSMVIHPFCIAPEEVDVVASDPDIAFTNLTGVQLNGCGGDVSTFEVSITGDGEAHRFDVVFVDAESGNEFGFIPVTINARHVRGAHRVIVEPGGGVDGLDFGNRPVATSEIHGVKWLDANGNGERDPGEPGLPGVTIYLDLNHNGRLDRGEPSQLSALDNPNTPVDEAGRYWFTGLRPGTYVVREIVPDNHVQTFPGVGAEILATQKGSYNPGVALDMDLADVSAAVNDDDSVDATVDVAVVWPDSCGMILEGQTAMSIVGNNLLIEVNGQQEGELCADVVVTQIESVEFESIKPGRYNVIATLHEDTEDGHGIPTRNVVGRIAVGGPGQHVVTLGVDEIVDGVDFGNQSKDEAVSIHGEKWLDRNGNGVRDRGEPGVAGVTIYSDLNLNGQFDEGEPHAVTMADDRNTRINEAGHYWLEGLKPGAHLITEILPDGFERTFPPPLDILAPWPLNEPYYFPNLLPGQILTGIDFGNHPTKVEGGSIHGRKWVDVNGNGMREPDEPGLPGVTIYLDANLNAQFDEGEQAVRTMRDDPDTDFDEAGLYWLEDVEPGFYIVREVVPDGFVQTFPPIFLCRAIFCTGRGHIVNVDSGQSLDGLDFGNQPVREPGMVHGRKWADRNGNGQRDEGEPGIPGVTIFADANLNGRLDRGEPRTTTMRDDPDTDFDEAGLYWLHVIPGAHLILEVVPDGFEQTFPNPAREIVHPYNLGHSVDVGPGEPIDGIDFGNQPVKRVAAVEGIKWLDRDGDGERDRGERGLPGVVIYSDLNRNGQRDRNEPFTRTQRDHPRTDVDESGHYRLEVTPGEHLIREEVPRGFRQTFPAGPTQVLDSQSENLRPGRARSYELVDASLELSANGERRLALTFEVVWPDGCGRLLQNRAEARIDGDQIFVQMAGRQVGPVCTLALRSETQTVHVEAPPAGKYSVNAVLLEADSPDGAFDESFLLKGSVAVGPRAGHLVSLEPGETAHRRNFGNRPIDRFHVADFNMDGVVDGVDIDLLALAVRGRASSDDFDLTQDGDVSEGDRDHMVRKVLEVPYGDSNLDGRFGSSDIVLVFQGGKYEDGIDDNASWVEGDWDGDGDFTSRDIVFVFQQGTYELDANAVDNAFGD